MKSLILILIFLNTDSTFSNKVFDIKGCTLQDYIEIWNINRDYEVLDSMINRDTFWQDENLRFGYYINAIGVIKKDSSASNSILELDTIYLHGDNFSNKGIEANFRKEYKAYIYKLLNEHKLRNKTLKENCSFLVHQRKFRACT